uniref:Uncharacterized protein n=1 Tax=Anguilla anguilla TaxID=7936 RepID=A0A0E9RX73_ANGAN
MVVLRVQFSTLESYSRDSCL